MARDLVRSTDGAHLLAQARRSFDELADEVGSVARDDAGPAGAREKAAEFIVHLRARPPHVKGIATLIDRAAEAAARARYRSSRVLDFVSFWLFVIGEQFIGNVSDAATLVDLELAHPELWNRTRANLLETLEGGAERMKTGRRFRLAETYLARLRLMRARGDERMRGSVSPTLSAMEQAVEPDSTDYVAAMAVDLFALSLSALQQRLVIAQIPSAHGVRGRSGLSEEYHRLWARLRAVRTDQAFERWERLCEELGLDERKAHAELCMGMQNHLRKTWDWFFPGRLPFGILAAVLRRLESVHHEDGEGKADEETAEKLFRRYSETLSFIVRLATEDTQSTTLDFEDDDSAGGVL